VKPPDFCSSTGIAKGMYEQFSNRSGLTLLCREARFARVCEIDWRISGQQPIFVDDIGFNSIASESMDQLPSTPFHERRSKSIVGAKRASLAVRQN
jgi:hypothetical protein